MKIIGGMFGFENLRSLHELSLPCLQGNHILLSNARSGIRLLVNQLRPGAVWLPSYLCDVLVKAVNPQLSTIKFFEIDYDLTVPSLAWLEGVQPGDLVVGIAYFGFAVSPGLVNSVHERQAWFLEDNSQALLSLTHDPQADFQLFSLHKFFGVPDGAILVARDPAFQFPIDLPPPPPQLWLQSLDVSLQRAEFDSGFGSREWFQRFRDLDLSAPFEPAHMSELSGLVMRYGVDYPSLSERRRANFLALLERLENIAIFTALPSGVVPLGFPVRSSRRDEIRQALFERQIYPIIHWDLHGFIPEKFQESHRLSREILTLICDQRYSLEDMHRTADIIASAGINLS